MEEHSRLQPRNPGESLKIAETVLKRRHHDIKGMAARAQKRRDIKKESSKRRITYGSITPEKMIKNARIKILDAKRVARLRRIESPCAFKAKHQETSPTLFVIRNMRMPVSKGSEKTLRKLGINRQWAATFLPNNKESLLTLKLIEPFVMYGYLNPQNIRELCLKRLRLRLTPLNEDENELDCCSESNNEEVVLSAVDNMMIEERLGHLGIYCLEDVIDEIQRCTNNFGDIMEHIQIDALILESGNIGFKINKKVQKLL